MSGFLIGRGGDNRRWRATAIVVAACFALFGLFGHAPGHSIAAVHRGGVATTTLTLMHFNDDYELTPTGNLGGMAFLAGQVDATRAQDPQALLLFAGDLLSPSVESSVFQGSQMITALDRLGVTAATFGNHEFDRGDAALTRGVAASRFPWLSSNVIVTASGAPFPGAVATMVTTVHGVKVGLLGLLTPETAILSNPGHDLTIEPVVTAARVAVARLTAQGATVIVAVTHENMSDDIALARAVPRLDLIVGGHDHVLWDATVGHTLITKAQSDAHYLGVVTADVGADGRVISLVDQPELIDPNNTTPDAAMTTLVKGYEARLSRQLSVVIGHSTTPLDARESVIRQKESGLGDFIADAMRAHAGTDVALVNSGGIRTDAVTPPGPITRKTILSFLPFGDLLVTERISGAGLKAALENGVSQWKDAAGRFPQVSGVRFTWSPSRPAGARILSVLVDGQPLSPTHLYTLATNDYLLGGGDGYASLAAGATLIGPTGAPLVSDIVIAAVTQKGTIAPGADGRITQLP